MGISLRDMLGNLGGRKTRQRRVTVSQARELLNEEEASRLIDPDLVREKAIERVEQSGIVFIDEIDKIARSESRGIDVSREGVQRDLLPIIEGGSVQTKHGRIRTDHILFIAAGAFHAVKPSDLIPELQGRFPIRVELSSLTREDFVRILSEPKNSLALQYVELLRTENVNIEFTPDGIEAVARYAALVNDRSDDIGARRLHTVMEKLIEQVSFDAPDLGSDTIVIDEKFVSERLDELVQDEDLSRFIL
jgi:ATP-dependent HslUV protease ATP-binding subunit HslU